MTTELVRATRHASLSEKIQYARTLADSGLLPSQYRKQPSNVLYAIEYGETVGISTMAAVTGVHVIEGKPTASAALISGLVRRAGHKLRVRGDDRQARAIIIRSDDPDFEFEAVWTVDRAVQAGLCSLRDGRPYARDSKGRPLPWEKFTAAMLKARAITEVGRDACEEVLFGLHYTPEELGAHVDEAGTPVDPPQVVRLQQADGDVWETSVPPSPAQVIADKASNLTDKAEVRKLYDKAKAEGLLTEQVFAADGTSGELGAYMYRIGERLAVAAKPAEEAPDENAGGEVVESELVPDDADEVAVARGEMLDAAAALSVPTPVLESDFFASYGHPIEDASVTELREMRDLFLKESA